MDKSRVDPTIFFIEKYHFLWNFFLVIFMGNPSLRLSEVLGFQDKLSIHAGQKYCRSIAECSKTFIKLPLVIKIFLLFIFVGVAVLHRYYCTQAWNLIRLDGCPRCTVYCHNYDKLFLLYLILYTCLFSESCSVHMIKTWPITILQRSMSEAIAEHDFSFEFILYYFGL